MKNDPKVIMWAAQTPVVVETLEREGISYVKKEYIEKKYGEVAWIFQTAYQFFISRFEKEVPRPTEAESPVWLYRDPKWAGSNPGVCLVKLEIPRKEILFFDLRKWSQVLNLSLVGTEKEQADFERELEKQGIKDSMDIFRKPFYPILKNRIMKSWDKLFDVDDVDEQYLQGAVWCLKKEWIKEMENVAL